MHLFYSSKFTHLKDTLDNITVNDVASLFCGSL